MIWSPISEKPKLSGDNENLVYNEAFENKIDDLVSNTSEQPKLSGDNENFVYNEAFVLKYYVLIGRTTFSSP